MNRNYDEKDQPLFPEKRVVSEEVPGDILSSNEVSHWERIAETKSKISKIERENEAHKFSMRLLWAVLLGLCIIVVVEYFPVIDNEFVQELFEFFKYVATTLVGYLFASHKKEE